MNESDFNPEEEDEKKLPPAIAMRNAMKAKEAEAKEAEAKEAEAKEAEKTAEPDPDDKEAIKAAKRKAAAERRAAAQAKRDADENKSDDSNEASKPSQSVSDRLKALKEANLAAAAERRAAYEAKTNASKANTDEDTDNDVPITSQSSPAPVTITEDTTKVESTVTEVKKDVDPEKEAIKEAKRKAAAERRAAAQAKRDAANGAAEEKPAADVDPEKEAIKEAKRKAAAERRAAAQAKRDAASGATEEKTAPAADVDPEKEAIKEAKRKAAAERRAAAQAKRDAASGTEEKPAPATDVDPEKEAIKEAKRKAAAERRAAAQAKRDAANGAAEEKPASADVDPEKEAIKEAKRKAAAERRAAAQAKRDATKDASEEVPAADDDKEAIKAAKRKAAAERRAAAQAKRDGETSEEKPATDDDKEAIKAAKRKAAAERRAAAQAKKSTEGDADAPASAEDKEAIKAAKRKAAAERRAAAAKNKDSKDSKSDVVAEKKAEESPQVLRGSAKHKANAEKRAAREAKEEAEEKPEVEDIIPEIKIPGFVPLEADQNPVVTHFPHAVADDHRPILPGTNEKRKTYFMNRYTFNMMAAGLFILTLVFYFIFLLNHIKLNNSNPVNSKRLAELEVDLRAVYVKLEDVKDKKERDELEAQKVAIQADYQTLYEHLNKVYWTLMEKKHWGTWVLFVSIILTVISFRITRLYAPNTPHPEPDPDKEEKYFRERRLATSSILVMVAFMVVVGISLYVFSHDAKRYPGDRLSVLMASLKKEGKEIKSKTYPVIAEEEFKKQWPHLRGLYGDGITNEDIPTDWDLKSGKHVLWSTKIPLIGMNSPVIWDDKIFLSGGVKGKRQMYAFERTTGAMLWQFDVGKGFKKGNPTVYDEKMYANPTVATDGQRVYAIFANGDLSCVDAEEGTKIWEKSFGLPKNAYGHASSLLIYKEKLIVQWDNKSSNAAIFALNLNDGSEIWKLDRNEWKDSWPSPIISEKSYDVTYDGKTVNTRLLLCAAPPGLTAINPDTGDFLWKVVGMHGDFGPSPIIANDLIIYAANAETPMYALDVNGKTKWMNEDVYPPGIPTPVADNEFIYVITENAEVTCMELATGKIVYEKDLEGFDEIYASPTIIGDKILVMDVKGKAAYIAKGKEFKLLSSTNLDKGTSVAPSFHNGAMYIRDGDIEGEKLFCIKKSE